jgi:bifunctional UDP-N-acetylglucosamine pyrophosphorylase/glucosamine-1-phosphate N-acetyltransferase
MDILVLAAGMGSRFFANSSKISVNFWGVPVVNTIIRQALNFSKNVYVVLRKGNIVEIQKDAKIIFQKEKYGTGAAVQSYLEEVKNYKDLLILPGDVPLIDEEALQLFKDHSKKADVLVGVMPMPVGKENYGRVIMEFGEIKKIIEYKNYKEKTEYANTGVLYCSKKVLPLIDKIKEKNQEIYLTDIVELAVKNGFKVRALMLSHEQAMGFNTISEFHNVLEIAQQKWRKKALQSQAIFFDINSVFLSHDTEFELGAVIEPFCRFLPKVHIGPKAFIKSFSSVEGAYVNGIVGPFANIRSGKIEENAQVGSFVEVNRSTIGANSKAKHLSYLGDCEIGENVTIGAGCVMCNYDGVKKHKSVIKKGAMIGANSSLIAPITVGEDAFLAAGGTFNKTVADGEFAISRVAQINKPNRNLEKKK